LFLNQTFVALAIVRFQSQPRAQIKRLILPERLLFILPTGRLGSPTPVQGRMATVWNQT